MPWVRFIQDFDFHPKTGVTIAYKRGAVLFVNTPCAEQAIAKGRAEKTENARRRSS